VRFRINPRLLAGRHARSRRVPPEASESPCRRSGGEQADRGFVSFVGDSLAS
jgi:hypothetical protein